MGGLPEIAIPGETFGRLTAPRRGWGTSRFNSAPRFCSTYCGTPSSAQRSHSEASFCAGGLRLAARRGDGGLRHGSSLCTMDGISTWPDVQRNFTLPRTICGRLQVTREGCSERVLIMRHRMFQGVRHMTMYSLSDMCRTCAPLGG